MAKILFKGYSSVGKKIGSTQLFDLNLAKQDLMNHFYTRRGERLMEPTFGSIIPTLLFNPISNETEDVIVQDAQEIVDSDPRFKLVTANSSVNADGNAITLNLLLDYVPDNKQVTMELQFDARAEEAI
jgi:phage baseplate assembly protein W